MSYGAQARAVLALHLIEVERNHESLAQTAQRIRVKSAPSAADGRLRDREEVVAVQDAVPSKPMLAAKRHLRRQAAHRSRHGSKGDIGQQRNRPIARDDDDWTSAAGQLDVVDLAAVQSGLPPSALSNAARPANPSSPIHSSCGCCA
jgi:hypothetical protein